MKSFREKMSLGDLLTSLQDAISDGVPESSEVSIEGCDCYGTLGGVVIERSDSDGTVEIFLRRDDT